MVGTALEFHELSVADVEQLTDDAVAVTLTVPPDLRDAFSYLAGQHVTVRAVIDGRDVRRSYSICANANSGKLRVGIKRLEGGAFSTWATTTLRPGDTLDVMPPIGEFTITPRPDAARHVCALAAGSGITPVLSLASTLLESEPRSRFTLVFGNKETASIMFLEEVEGLKDRYPDRFHLVHVLSREAQVIPLHEGRVDAAKLDELSRTILDVADIDEWYLCGPYEMVQGARRFLDEHGVEGHRVHDELFFAGPTVVPPPPPPPDTDGLATVSFTLDGRTSVVLVDPQGPPVLDHALRVRPELPFSCRGGVCATCKARVVRGNVDMEQNWALVPEEIEAGFVLTCQSHPTTDELVLDYDV